MNIVYEWTKKLSNEISHLVESVMPGLPSYSWRFLWDYPECCKKLKDNNLLQGVLKEACLASKEPEVRAYQALCAYYGKPMLNRERIVFDNGMTLVHFAALGGQESCVEGEDLGDINGSFVAHYLAMGGHKELLDRINRDKLFIHDETGLSSLDYAFLYKKNEVVDWFAEQEDLELAYLMKDILLSPDIEDERLYTSIGIRILKLLVKAACYAQLKNTKKPLEGLLVLFSHCYLIFDQHLGCSSIEKRKTWFADAVGQSYLKYDQQARFMVTALSEIVEQKIGDKISSLAGHTYDEGDFEQPVSFILDRILEVRSFSQSGYELVENQNGGRSELGAGSFSTVYQIKDRQGGFYALKAYTSKRENQWYNYLRVANSENIERFVQKKDFVFFEDKPAAIMKLYAMNLYQIIQFKKGDSDYLNSVQSFVIEILKAMVFLHAQGIVHTDLKPENILVNSPFQVVLGDFDAAYRKDFPSRASLPPNDLQTGHYRSPECFLHAKDLYGCEMDMWSLGCVLFELFSAIVLFPITVEEEIVSEQEYPRAYPEYEEVVPRQQEYLGAYPEELLKAASEERFAWYATVPVQIEERSLRAVVDKSMPRNGCLKEGAKFLRFFDLLTKIMRLKPWERMLPQEALEHLFFAFSNAPKEGG